jgi:hypothetical protein
MLVLANAKPEEVALAYISDRREIGWRAYRKGLPDRLSSSPKLRSATC